MNKLIPEIETQPDIISTEENGVRVLGYTPDNFAKAIKEYANVKGIVQGELYDDNEIYAYDTFTDDYPFYVMDNGKYRYILEQKFTNNEWISE
jgi:hypothetical protein